MTEQVTEMLTTNSINRIVSAMPPDLAVTILFHIVVGRPPDQNGHAYYVKRFEGSLRDRLDAIHELTSSDESRKYGLISASRDGALNGVDLGEAIAPALMFAMIGVIHRQAVERAEKMVRLEEAARLTLLSVPEWCGSAYDRLEARIAKLESLREGMGNASG